MIDANDFSLTALFKWVVGLLIGLLSFLGIRMHNAQDGLASRIADLERALVSRGDLDRCTDKLEQQLGKHQSEMREDMTRIFKRLDEIADRQQHHPENQR